MSEAIEIALGKRIREMREAAGLTQSELAALTLKSVETISNFERGKTIPSVRTLAAIAERMECSIADFFEKNQMQTEPNDPVMNALIYKSKLIDGRDKLLLTGFLDLLINQTRK